MKPSDLARVIIDTTVQPKAVMFPTDAKLAHAHQFKRANKALRKLRTYLGRVIRDVGRRIEGNDVLQEVLAKPMSLARRVRDQDRHQRGPKVYSLHAPEAECIGKGKAHRPYEFGVKASVVTPLKRSSGGQFVAHVAALPGNPYDGHTLSTVIPAMEQMIGNPIERALTDAGYRGHNAPPSHRFKIYTAGRKRRVTPQIKREFKRRAAVEPGSPQGRAPHGMQSPRSPRRRRHQRHACRGRLQLPHSAQVAQPLVARNLGRPHGDVQSSSRLKVGKFTDD
jgi:IS5 family transposase